MKGNRLDRDLAGQRLDGREQGALERKERPTVAGRALGEDHERPLAKRGPHLLDLCGYRPAPVSRDENGVILVAQPFETTVEAQPAVRDEDRAACPRQGQDVE